jgi:hypothetical protein
MELRFVLTSPFTHTLSDCSSPPQLRGWREVGGVRANSLPRPSSSTRSSQGYPTSSRRPR